MCAYVCLPSAARNITEDRKKRETSGWDLSSFSLRLCFFPPSSSVSNPRRQPGCIYLPAVRRLGNPPAGESGHTSWWMPWNLPAERLSRAPESRGTHGELQSTKVSDKMLSPNVWTRWQCCGDFGRVSVVVLFIREGEEGEICPVLASYSRVFYHWRAFVCLVSR